MRLMKMIGIVVGVVLVFSTVGFAEETAEEDVLYVKTTGSSGSYGVEFKVSSNTTYSFALTGAPKEDYWLNLLMINIINRDETSIIITSTTSGVTSIRVKY